MVKSIEADRIVPRGQHKGNAVRSVVVPMGAAYNIYRPAPGKILETTVGSLDEVLGYLQMGFRTRWGNPGLVPFLAPGILTVEPTELLVTS